MHTQRATTTRGGRPRGPAMPAGVSQAASSRPPAATRSSPTAASGWGSRGAAVCSPSPEPPHRPYQRSRCPHQYLMHPPHLARLSGRHRSSHQRGLWYARAQCTPKCWRICQHHRHLVISVMPRAPAPHLSPRRKPRLRCTRQAHPPQMEPPQQTERTQQPQFQATRWTRGSWACSSRPQPHNRRSRPPHRPVPHRLQAQNQPHAHTGRAPRSQRPLRSGAAPKVSHRGAPCVPCSPWMGVPRLRPCSICRCRKLPGSCSSCPATCTAWPRQRRRQVEGGVPSRPLWQLRWNICSTCWNRRWRTQPPSGPPVYHLSRSGRLMGRSARLMGRSVRLMGKTLTGRHSLCECPAENHSTGLMGLPLQQHRGGPLHRFPSVPPQLPSAPARQCCHPR